MPQDAFHIRRSAAELDAALKGGKINRVSQADKDEVTLIIYTGKSTVKLVLSTNASNARVCLSATEKEPAPVAPNFCMLLRKHLLGAEILSVSQHEFERIVEIRLRCTGDFSRCERVLVCEIMGKYSNLVLTENGTILGALKTTSLEDNVKRVLLSGAKYVYPLPQDKLSPFDAEGLKARTEAFRARSRGKRAGGIRKIPFRKRRGAGSAHRAGALKQVLPRPPRLGICRGILRLLSLLALSEKGKRVPDGLFRLPRGRRNPHALPERGGGRLLFRERGQARLRGQKAEAGIRRPRTAQKQRKKLQDTLERLDACSDMEKERVKGELLTANLWRIEKGMKELEAENWYSPDGGTIKIALDERLSPSQNAQRYFKAYQKQKRTLDALLPRRKTEEEEISYSESVLSSLAAAETQDDLKETETELVSLGLVKPQRERVGAKKKETVVPFREYEYMGFRIFGGRNNLQNDRLLKSCSPSDIWLHAQKYHSSHVIVAAEGKKVPEEVLLFAAEICAYYSDGRSGGKVPVDYCERKHVKKPPKSKAGFVVYDNYKTLLVEPNKHE